MAKVGLIQNKTAARLAAVSFYHVCLEPFPAGRVINQGRGEMGPYFISLVTLPQ